MGGMRTYSFRDLILTLDRWVIKNNSKGGMRIVTIEYLILALYQLGKIDIMGGLRIVTIDYLILAFGHYNTVKNLMGGLRAYHRDLTLPRPLDQH